MNRILEKSRPLFFVLAVAIVGCSRGDGGSVSTARPALTTTNGLAQNGLTTNGLVENGMWSNGMWSNGMWSNGMWSNGMWSNGMWSNGMWSNGMWSNGMWSNGMWSNGMWSNGFTGAAGIPGDTLRSSGYARQLLQYIYSCAMPAATYDTTLDPNADAPLFCASDQDCDVGYACAEQRCVIPLKGGGANGSGLAVNADGSTWWADGGTCDESCQRWVSACVLARTNAYGVHVQISMRAPANPPADRALQFGKIGAALATTPAELAEFGLREGAFYGNIFATTPTTAVPAGGSGPATGPIASTPSYYACAGPGSNIPAITKRFCSSQGDQVVINVPGVCVTNATETGVCDGVDATGSIFGCATTTSTTQPRTHYDEVITVYLRSPIAVCGNAVCEDDGTATSPETTESCPSDCHPGTWARDIAPSIEYNLVAGAQFNARHGFEQRTLFENDSMRFSMAVVAPTECASPSGPCDDPIVLPGTATDNVDLGGGLLAASGGVGVLAKYRSDGAYAWGVRFGNLPAAGSNSRLSQVNGAVVAQTGEHKGEITVVGAATDPSTVTTSIGSVGPTAAIWVSRYDADGVSLGSWSVPFSVTNQNAGALLTRAFGVDSQGNVVVAGYFSGGDTTFTMGGTTLVSQNPNVNKGTTFIAKIALPGSGAAPLPPVVMWVHPGQTGPLSLVVDAADDIVLDDVEQTIDAAGQERNFYHLSKLSPDGATLWSHSIGWVGSAGARVTIHRVAVDASGNVYASGSAGNGADFGGGPVTGRIGLPPFLVKYDRDGNFTWVNHANIVCPPTARLCSSGSAGIGGDIAFDPDGNVLVGRFGRPAVGGGIDFGVGPFPTYASDNMFVTAYSPDGQIRWAKQVPAILSSNLLDMALDSQGRVILSGNYSGSMQVDDRLLVTSAPEQPLVIDTFLASFAAPSLRDGTAPAIGDAHDQNGAPIFTVPQDIVVEATGPTGAVVFFMPPTALDGGNAGTSVWCSPAPNTTFPLGKSTVTCTASDPLGNSAGATFSVTVVDRSAPVFSPVPADVNAAATSKAGATVPYPTPTAIDQVEGPGPVLCTPASGSAFPFGATTVTCTSADSRGNDSSASFTVSVADTTPPVPTLPGPITATATSANGAVVTYTATAFDAIDGVITPVCTPASGSTFRLGATTVTCTATDAAGNKATGSFQVNVQYSWSGVLQPIDADGNSVFKLGSTVSVKFQLTGASAGIANAVAKLALAQVSANVMGSDIEAISTSAATTGNLFRYDGSQYAFNLSTKGLSVGTWRVSIDLGDNVSRTVLISLR